MSKSLQTKSALLDQARVLFWSRGYSNVSLREIARAAGVDVALVSRYFGSKRGLFDATLDDLPALDPAQIDGDDGLLAMVINLFATAPRGGPTPSPTSLILMNAGDPEVGAAVRAAYEAKWQRPLELIIGNKGSAAVFSAAMLGMSVAEKSLHLDSIAPPDSEQYRTQFRGLLQGALNARDDV